MTEANVEAGTSDVDRQIGNLIVGFLSDAFGGEEVYDELQPLITIAVRVGVQQGTAAAIAFIEGIVSGDSYSSWQVAIEVATPAERLEIAEAARQLAIADRLRELVSKDAWASVGKVAFQAMVSIVALLL